MGHGVFALTAILARPPPVTESVAPAAGGSNYSFDAARLCFVRGNSAAPPGVIRWYGAYELDPFGLDDGQGGAALVYRNPVTRLVLQHVDTIDPAAPPLLCDGHGSGNLDSGFESRLTVALGTPCAMRSAACRKACCSALVLLPYSSVRDALVPCHPFRH